MKRRPDSIIDAERAEFEAIRALSDALAWLEDEHPDGREVYESANEESYSGVEKQ